MRKVFLVLFQFLFASMTLIAQQPGVGINTTTPDRRLDIESNDGNPQLRITHTDNSVYTDFTTTASGHLVIEPSGFNVGIGSSAPTSTLDVAGKTTTINFQMPTGAVNNYILVTDASGNASWQDPTTVGGTGDITAVTAGTGLTGGGTSGAITINAVGDNGLTTNTDDIDLGGILNQITTIDQSTFDMIFDLTSTGVFEVRDNGSTTLLVSDNGNIGIGSSAPTNALDVVGKIKTTNFQMTNGAAVNLVLMSDASGNATWTNPNGLSGLITGVTAGAGLTGGGTTGTVIVTAAANNGLNVDGTADKIQLGGALTEATTISQAGFGMIYDLTGTGDFEVRDAGSPALYVADSRRVGIGTNNPTTLLEVGTGAADAIITFVDGGATTQNSIDFATAGTSAPALADGWKLRLWGNGAYDGSDYGFGINGSTLWMNTGGTDIDFYGGGALVATIQNGELGIGVANPTQKLHVQGGARITSLGGGGVQIVTTDNNGVLSVGGAVPTGGGRAELQPKASGSRGVAGSQDIVNITGSGVLYNAKVSNLSCTSGATQASMSIIIDGITYTGGGVSSPATAYMGSGAFSAWGAGTDANANVEFKTSLQVILTKSTTCGTASGEVWYALD